MESAGRRRRRLVVLGDVLPRFVDRTGDELVVSGIFGRRKGALNLFDQFVRQRSGRTASASFRRQLGRASDTSRTPPIDAPVNQLRVKLKSYRNKSLDRLTDAGQSVRLTVMRKSGPHTRDSIAMRNVIFGINMTADGFYGHENMVADEAVHIYFTELLRSAGVLLYGRKTYQLMIPYWPTVAKDQSMPAASNEFARVFTALEMSVFSTTLPEVEGANRRLLRGGLAEHVLELKRQPGKDICVGSLSLAAQLSERGLIDEYRFVVHPVVAGDGPQLFDAVKLRERIRLELIDSQTFPSGAVALHYRRGAHERQ